MTSANPIIYHTRCMGELLSINPLWNPWTAPLVTAVKNYTTLTRLLEGLTASNTVSRKEATILHDLNEALEYPITEYKKLEMYPVKPDRALVAGYKRLLDTVIESWEQQVTLNTQEFLAGIKESNLLSIVQGATLNNYLLSTQETMFSDRERINSVGTKAAEIAAVAKMLGSDYVQDLSPEEAVYHRRTCYHLQRIAESLEEQLSTTLTEVSISQVVKQLNYLTNVVNSYITLANAEL